MKEERFGLARQDFSSYAQLDATLTDKGYNTGYSQFFIMAEDEAQFDGLYTAFGKVIEGMDIVDELLTLETEKEKEVDEETGEETDKEIETTMPINKPVIKNVTVDTFGIKYGEPELVETFDMNAFLMSYYGLSF